MDIVILALLGLCFGSFINALVYRLHEQHKSTKKGREAENLSIINGRSRCVHCGHTLVAQDLIPVLSWLSLSGKCRYCKKPISWQYPTVELITAGLFIFSYLFWPFELDAQGIILLGLWLAILVGLIALTVYDLRWMLLPNRILVWLYPLAAIFIGVKMASEASPMEVLINSIGGIVIGGGIFYLLFQVSKGKWIGGGDVKLGFLLGALVGTPVLAMLVLFAASVFGTLISIPLLMKKRKKSLQIPFGPFLFAAAVFVLLFGTQVIDWYNSYVLGMSL